MFTRDNSHDAFDVLSRRLLAGEGYVGLKWQMTLPERLGLIQLLRTVRPTHALEVGTAQGGSLAVLHQFTTATVHSLDVDPTCAQRLGEQFPRARFTTGDSRTTLPRLLDSLAGTEAYPDVVLLDGKHTPEALAADLAAVLARPLYRPFYLLIHDSFNPLCRAAILAAPWRTHPSLTHLEVDYVPGVLHERADVRDQMWGGLSLAIFDPYRPPQAQPVLNAAYAHLFDVALERSRVVDGQY